MTEESLIRLGIFMPMLGLILLWGWIKPFRTFPEAKLLQLGRHLGLMLFNFACLRLLSGGGAYLWRASPRKGNGGC